MKTKTDKQKLENLLTEFGVAFIKDGDSIMCNQGEEKIEGYLGFNTEFTFNENGEFIEMGAYE